jgi:S-adenosylmethionine decarboxylase proenzyme
MIAPHDMQATAPSAPIQYLSAGHGGIHLVGDFSGCRAPLHLMEHAGSLRDLCLTLVNQSGLTVVGDAFHQFEPVGVTGTVLLAESHLAIHTWPELAFVSLDVFVCNYIHDNSEKAYGLFSRLAAALKPAVREVKPVRRLQPFSLRCEEAPQLHHG